MFALVFSCQNSTKEVRDFLAHRNLPLGVLEGVEHVYKDSGRVTLKINAKKIRDFANRKKHPYQEFSNGIHMVTYNSKNRDSTSIFGDYAWNYQKTGIAKIKGNVIVINHKEKTRLETDLMYWDQKRHYYFTQSPFLLITYTPKKDTIATLQKKEDYVRVLNHRKNTSLKIPLFWYRKLPGGFTQNTPPKNKLPNVKYIDTISGVGFESRENLNFWEMQNTSGVINQK